MLFELFLKRKHVKEGMDERVLQYGDRLPSALRLMRAL